MRNSCLDCDERHPACHDSCNVYREFKKHRAEINEKHRQFMDGHGYDGCLAPKSGRLKGYDQTKFRY